MKDSKIEEESKRATKMLRGKVVSKVFRYRIGEAGIEFTDGTRFFVDQIENGLDLSITEGRNQDENL